MAEFPSLVPGRKAINTGFLEPKEAGFVSQAISDLLGEQVLSPPETLLNNPHGVVTRNKPDSANQRALNPGCIMQLHFSEVRCLEVVQGSCRHTVSAVS